jgi:hypothetical protein
MKLPELYHGTQAKDIEFLEPRVPRSFYSTGDEEPVVCASPDIEYAIFMAVIGSRRWGGWSANDFGNKGFYVYDDFADILVSNEYQEPDGLVYFLDNSTFEHRSSYEWRSKEPVKALGSIAVGARDLPQFAICKEGHSFHYKTK